MLRAAETDALRAEAARRGGIGRRVGVRADLEAAAALAAGAYYAATRRDPVPAACTLASAPGMGAGAPSELPDLSLADNVDVPLRYRGWNGKQRRRAVGEMLDLVGLGSRKDYLPSQLSGGQQQRVAIARALAGKPRFLLADEPTGNLDSEMAEAVMGLLEAINAEGTTIVMVTHDPDLARRAHRNIHILDGRASDVPLAPVAPTSCCSSSTATSSSFASTCRLTGNSGWNETTRVGLRRPYS